MLYRTLIPIAVLAVAACSVQKTRPPPAEPASTTSVTRAELTAADLPTPAPPEETLPEPSPMAPRYREALANNPRLAGVSLEHIQIQQTDGHITLRGRMPTIADKVQVEISLRQIKGVTSVTNDIRVR